MAAPEPANSTPFAQHDACQNAFSGQTARSMSQPRTKTPECPEKRGNFTLGQMDQGKIVTRLVLDKCPNPKLPKFYLRTNVRAQNCRKIVLGQKFVSHLVPILRQCGRRKPSPSPGGEGWGESVPLSYSIFGVETGQVY